jgi:diketogulonate reductase-like aldo/keto reductase
MVRIAGHEPQGTPGGMGVPTITLPDGTPMPVLGAGTWGYAEDPSRRDDEVASLRAALDVGLTLVDTAEMYADGGAEELVGEALAGRRDEAFVVDKVLPGDADRRGTHAACERALRRLRTDRIDLYLLHWRGRRPLAETVTAFEELRAAGKIGAWGVSNLDTDDLDELVGLAAGTGVATDQILYNLTRRGPEWELLPWARRHGLPVMAYSPVEQGRLLDDPTLREVADRHGATPAQVAIAWVLGHPGVAAIPKTGTPGRMAENRGALDVRLTDEDHATLDAAFPPPDRRHALEIL